MILAALAAPATLRTSPGWAQQTVAVEGYVVALENGEVIVDIAKEKGARGGDTVELWRPLKLKHPVTGRMVTDRFRIGTLKLTQVRDALALAIPEGKLARPPEPGDVVVLHKQASAPKPTPLGEAQPPESGQPAAPTGDVVPADPEAKRVTEIFEALRGAGVVPRIRAYEDYVRSNPKSRFAAVLYEEAAQLRRLLLLEEQVGEAPRPELISFEPPAEALAGVPISFGVELTVPARGAVFHSRHTGEVANTSTPMQAAGERFWVATVPAERAQSPRLEYFIEAVSASGEAVAVVGHDGEPERLSVQRIPSPEPALKHEVTVAVWTDWADWNQLEGNDRVWQTEGYVGMRFADTGVRALRTGFGVYRGVGGTLEDLDELGKSPRRVGLTYGYVETEFGISHFTGLIVRPIIGLDDDGVSGGAQALIRLGNDKSTNLMLGGEVLGGVGIRGITQLELAVFERVPIMFRTEVTNQPAGASVGDDEELRPFDPDATREDTSTATGELGARAIAQVGYRPVPSLMVAVRGSYQGRTINHAGPGVGGALEYTW